MEPNTTMNESSVGPVIATIIILAVIVLGGLYFWHERKVADNSMTPTASSTNAAAGIESQSSSDNTSSIDADLKSTNTTNVNGTMNAS